MTVMGLLLCHRRRGQSVVPPFVTLAVSSLVLVIAANARSEVNLETRVSAGVSDNIALAFEGGDKIEETIQRVATRFLITGETDRTNTNLAGTFRYDRYLHGSFENELVGGAVLRFTGDIVPERFRWIATDNFGQQPVDH